MYFVCFLYKFVWFLCILFGFYVLCLVFIYFVWFACILFGVYVFFWFLYIFSQRLHSSLRRRRVIIKVLVCRLHRAYCVVVSLEKTLRPNAKIPALATVQLSG